VLAVPEATRSDTCTACSSGLLGTRTCRPWAATPACCKNLTSVDDSAYLMNVVASVKTKYAVDDQRIFIAGQDAGCVALPPVRLAATALTRHARAACQRLHGLPHGL
jgi:hypothetical protein